MRVGVFLLLFAAGSVTSAYAYQAPSSGSANRLSGREQAQNLALIGHNQLHLGRLADAQANCDAALRIDPTNEVAKDCLNLAVSMLVDQELNRADAKLLTGDRAGATSLASRPAASAPRPDQRERGQAIIDKARGIRPLDVFNSFVPDWLRQVLVTLVSLTVLALLLLLARQLWSEWERGKWSRASPTTRWRVMPLKEASAAPDAQTGIPTEATLDALSRLGHELARELWQPKLLLLRPTPPANHEPAIIDAFLSDALCDVVLAPATEDLRVQWTLHNFELDQALQSLQLSAKGIDIGSVARLIRSGLEWFNAGAPTLSGFAQIAADQTASIHLFARGGRIESAAISASTAPAPGIDPVQLSAERAAFKFLFRMQYPEMTNDEIDGFSALRQGATLFAQYAGTVPGAGEDVNARTSSLARAAFNFGFFRASIPPHCQLPCKCAQQTSLNITDEIRQAVLLGEGVAHSLVGNERNYMLAIDCFRQLQDWPGSAQTEALRQQAAYNEALVWRALGSHGQCVLMLITLLGKRAPDTIEPAGQVAAANHPAKPALPEAIALPARLACLGAFARYDRNDLSLLPKERSKMLIDDAEALVHDLQRVERREGISAHDRRLARYMYIEALRSIGHVELQNLKAGSASRLYQGQRPLGLKTDSLTAEETGQLRHALSWMLTCEQFAPNCDLFCDLAEAYILLKDFSKAEGFARHATLKRNPDDERAYYLATESCLLQNTAESTKLAKKYATSFNGPATFDEFKSIRAELGIS